MRHAFAFPTVTTLLALFMVHAGPVAAKEPLDHDVYTRWNRIQEQGISADGAWAFWAMSPEEADGSLVAATTDGDSRYEVPRGESARFSHDSRYLVYQVHPEHEALRQAKLDEELDETAYPKTQLGILDLESGERTSYERVDSFAMPEEAGGWIAWRHHQPEKEDDEEKEGNGKGSDGEDKERADDQSPGTELVLRELASGEEWRFEHVSAFAFSPEGGYLAFVVTTPDGEGDGVYVLEPGASEPEAIVRGEGRYIEPVFDEAGEQLAFLGRPTPPEAGEEDAEPSRPEHAFSLYHWRTGDGQAQVMADETAGFLEDDWHVSRHRAPSFSDSGERLFFGTAPQPVDIPDNEDLLDEEVVKVDVWHWQDDRLQPQQLEELEEDRERTYLAVAHLDDDGARMVQLGREAIPEVEKAGKGDADTFLGLSNLPYRREISWDYPRYYDAWRIDADSGRAEMILKAVQHRPELSPAGGYVTWWDRERQTWFAMDPAERSVTDLGEGIDYRLGDHRNDRPFADNPYGQAGWLEDDAAIILHDRHDLWRVDPATGDARRLTGGDGRERGWRYRFVDLDPDEPAIDPEKPLLLTAFDEANKDHGFAHVAADGEGAPEQRVMTAHQYGTPEKAEESERLLFTRENFQAFPDLYVADTTFSDITRLSDANPQQSDYRWGQVELVEWTGETGRDHEGLLYRPEDFDPDKRYPMIVYFYERSSDGLHNHRPPQAHRSVIIPTFYTSNDYVVFVPDVWYREGAPGESAMESIMPKTRELADEPWIDADRVAMQGHSWAGYQIAYMVTQTDFFRAAAGGAPVANMTSAYGGIRWRTGMSRMFQYEDTQSRLGTTLWEDRERYVDNSPLFMADRINTPLLMLHNDQDGAVPWEQGIELFTALRRLNRPAWLINYNDEPHWPQRFANREDWQIRLKQFFDHYLKDEPAPRWLSSGIPALEKGATLGRE